MLARGKEITNAPNSVDFLAISLAAKLQLQKTTLYLIDSTSPYESTNKYYLDITRVRYLQISTNELNDKEQANCN